MKVLVKTKRKFTSKKQKDKPRRRRKLTGKKQKDKVAKGELAKGELAKGELTKSILTKGEAKKILRVGCLADL